VQSVLSFHSLQTFAVEVWLNTFIIKLHISNYRASVLFFIYLTIH